MRRCRQADQVGLGNVCLVNVRFAREVGTSAAGRDTVTVACIASVRNAIEPEIKLDQDGVPDPTALRGGLAWARGLATGFDVLAAVDVEKTRDMNSGSVIT